MRDSREHETSSSEDHADQRDNDRLGNAYDRIIGRFGDRTDHLSREGLQRELDEAVQFEADVEEFTRDELALLRAWVSRDLGELRRYLGSGGSTVADWLGIDLDVLSARLRNGLFSIADRTPIDQLRFEEDLEAAQADYCEGEIAAPGRMTCVHCGEQTTLGQRQRLGPCPACGHRWFRRDTTPIR